MVLISTDGDSFKALMTHLLNIPANKISKVKVPTGVFNIYDFITL